MEDAWKGKFWLNPLLGLPNYKPLTIGMETALPFIDDFLAVHNLRSLEKLADHLLQLNDRRPIRRQQTASPIPLTRSGQAGIFPSIGPEGFSAAALLFSLLAMAGIVAIHC